MSGMTVTRMVRNVRYGPFGGERHGWDAIVHHDGHTFHMSRLDDMPDSMGHVESWVCDALFGPGFYPHWCHSFGERTTAARVASDEMAALLDAAAAAAHV